jgi:uncharacterized protein with PIN domain
MGEWLPQVSAGRHDVVAEGERCPYCGTSVAGHLRCPLCDTRLVSVSVSLRRALLWAFVVEELLLVVLLMRMRLG